MFSWLIGNKQTINKVSFEDIQWIIKGDHKKYLLINTLDKKQQDCLITGTIPIDKEVEIINKFLKKSDTNIIIYGKNTNDSTIYNKHQQLLSLGFNKVYIYPGGLFEWLCLQDIYGSLNFPTLGSELDILKYRPLPEINKNYYIEDSI
jgi:rhodanese-related sulfurtransferase|tara:strand:+ start:468 stop:911 length:444 start_codon:yes stop_codon:yes gene_type:complete